MASNLKKYGDNRAIPVFLIFMLVCVCISCFFFLFKRISVHWGYKLKVYLKKKKYGNKMTGISLILLSIFTKYSTYDDDNKENIYRHTSYIFLYTYSLHIPKITIQKKYFKIFSILSAVFCHYFPV